MGFLGFGKKSSSKQKVDLSTLPKILEQIDLINKKTLQAKTIITGIRNERHSILKKLIFDYNLNLYMNLSRETKLYDEQQEIRLNDLIHRELEVLNIFIQGVPNTLGIITDMKEKCKELGLGQNIIDKIVPLQDFFSTVAPTLVDFKTRLTEITNLLNKKSEDKIKSFEKVKELLAQEDAERERILTHFKPGLMRECKDFFDKIAFFAKQHKAQEIAAVLGISVAALAVAFAPEIAQGIKTTMDAVKPVGDAMISADNFLNKSIEMHPSTWSDDTWHAIYALSFILTSAIGIGVNIFMDEMGSSSSKK